MDGNRLQEFRTQEIKALLASYQQFATLIPSDKYEGSAHHGEDGRFVEDLLKEYLTRHLPNGIEILTGFILRPAVKTGKTGKERKNDTDMHSTQLDLIVFDSERYPVFQRFGNSCIVPPEGVIAIISVKKHLNRDDIVNECKALWDASKLCQTISSNNKKDKIRGPFLALVSMRSKIENKTKDNYTWIFDKMKEAYNQDTKPSFDDIVGFIGALDKWSIFKARPKPQNDPKNASFMTFIHKDDEEHLGLQFILSGIFSVFYDETRRDIRRPGFTAFESGRNVNKFLGTIDCSKLR